MRRCSAAYRGVTHRGAAAARAFATYFESVYLPNTPRLDASIASQCGNSAILISVLRLDMDDLNIAFKKFKRSIGPDGLPGYVIRGCSDSLSKPLLFLFNLSLVKGVYPTRWKVTRVTPVPKSGSKSEVTNYRPIAIFSSVAKLFDFALYRRIYPQYEGQMADIHHGFRAGRSTTTNLTCLVEDLARELDHGGQVDVAYFDYQKAFDRVDNDVLINRLGEAGFSPTLLNFFSSYLADRRQYVRFNNFESNLYFTRSGVSQGSNLGPLLFTILVNGLGRVVRETRCLMFADDLKLYTVVSRVADCRGLQRDIDNVTEWSEASGLQLNPDKCSVVSYSRARDPLYHNYYIGTDLLRYRVEIID